MTREMIVKHPNDVGILNAIRGVVLGELRVSPRGRRFGGNFTAVQRAARLPQCTVMMQTIDQRPGRRQTEDRFDKKTTGLASPGSPMAGAADPVRNARPL